MNINEKKANMIIYRLIDENCFAENRRLGIFPGWLTMEDMSALVSVGIFRREQGNLENMMHTNYYLNPCCEKQLLSSDCTYPNCALFHFQKLGIKPDPTWFCDKCKTENADGVSICGFCDSPRFSG